MKYFVLSLLISSTFPFYAPQAVSQPNVHPAFTAPTAQQTRAAFEDYETKGAQCAKDRVRGRRCPAVMFSPEQPLNIPVQTVRGVELLTFRVSISTPQAQIRWMGYRFGLLGTRRTPDDREDSLRRLITRMQEAPKTITFTVKLIARQAWETTLPTFSFALVNRNQQRLWSSSQPDFECSGQDLICQVGLKESGQPVSFPLFVQLPTTPPSAVPFITDAMQTLKLLVTIDGHEEPIEFDLRTL